MRFEDRTHAGRLLADALRDHAAQDVVVLALPRGGVVVGVEVARALSAPLDLVIPRKVGHPDFPEYAIAAVAEAGDVVANEQETARVDRGWFERAVAAEQAEAARRRASYLGGRPAVELTGKTAIIVDDGIATGLTMQAAVRDARRPRRGAGGGGRAGRAGRCGRGAPRVGRRGGDAARPGGVRGRGRRLLPQVRPGRRRRGGALPRRRRHDMGRALRSGTEPPCPSRPLGGTAAPEGVTRAPEGRRRDSVPRSLPRHRWPGPRRCRRPRSRASPRPRAPGRRPRGRRRDRGTP
jgi:adenine/guanine phosphoribosyltransferase-like PRPP-binding protein